MPDTHHPCGSLPVHGWNLGVYWCEHHQTFFAHAGSYVQRGDGAEPTDHTASTLDLGPFDDVEAVQSWMRQQWVAYLNGLRAADARYP